MFGSLLGALIALKIVGFEFSVWWLVGSAVGYIAAVIYDRTILENFGYAIIENIKHYSGKR